MSVNRILPIALLSIAALGPLAASDEPIEQFPLTIISERDSGAPKRPLWKDVGETESSKFFDSQPLHSTIRKITVASIVLIAVCGSIIWLANQKKATQDKMGQRLRVVETITLAPRCHVDLLDVQGQYFIVTRDATGLRATHQVHRFEDELDDELAGVDELNDNNGQATPPVTSGNHPWTRRTLT